MTANNDTDSASCQYNYHCSQAVKSQFSLVVRSVVKLCTNLKKVLTPTEPEAVRLSGSRGGEEQQEIVIGQDMTESHL